MPRKQQSEPRTIRVKVLKSFDQFREGETLELQLTEWAAHLIADNYFEELPWTPPPSDE